MGLFQPDWVVGHFEKKYGQLVFIDQEGSEFNVANEDAIVVTNKVLYKVEYHNTGLLGLGNNINIDNYRPKAN